MVGLASGNDRHRPSGRVLDDVMALDRQSLQSLPPQTTVTSQLRFASCVREVSFYVTLRRNIPDLRR